jgi:hypothetical protein
VRSATSAAAATFPTATHAPGSTTRPSGVRTSSRSSRISARGSRTLRAYDARRALLTTLSRVLAHELIAEPHR